MTGAAAIIIAAVTLFLGRRDLTRPAVAFGVVWFTCVAIAQLRLTDLQGPWSDGFTASVFAGGLALMLAATLAGGTAAVRGRVAARREDYRVRNFVLAALVLFAMGIAGTIYKAHILDGLPLLSGRADELRGRAYEVGVPAWSTALGNGFFLAMWCALAAVWVGRGRLTRLQLAALWLLVAASLGGVALLASRNSILFALVIPLVGVYLIARPTRRIVRVGWVALTASLLVLVVGGVFVARVAQDSGDRQSFLERELARQPAALDPIMPFYINAVYPLEAASRLYEVVPDRVGYARGGNSLTSLPDAAFPNGKPPYGTIVTDLMVNPDGLGWAVASYHGRLYGDAGWPGLMLGSLLLGLLFGALYRWARGRAGLVPVALVGYVAYYAAFMAYDNFLSFTIIAVYDLTVVALVDLYARGALDPLFKALATARRSLSAPS